MNIQIIPNYYTILLILTVIIGFALWLALRKRWIFPSRPGAFLPLAAPSAGRTARLVEATMLSAAAIIVIAISATNPSTGGYLLRLDSLKPEYARINVIMFACAVAGAGIAVLVALLGRTLAGVIIMVVSLIGYGFILNGGRQPGSWFLPSDMMKTVVHYTIDLSGVNIEGAELWVNGVYLGKTPYITTLDEFLAQVPYWPEEPEDFKTNTVAIPKYSPGGISTSIHRRWITLRVPEVSYSDEWATPSVHDWKTYYARVRYAGQRALHAGGGGGGGTGGSGWYSANSDLDVFFPERQNRLDALLNKARLANYRVGPEWFAALETYNEDAWLALDKAAQKEPQMAKVLDDWAAWRYQLDKAVDVESAWEIFQRICVEAETERQYVTASVAGRAVELLTPKLTRDRLVEKAVEIIRDTGPIAYFQVNIDDRLQFGASERPGGVSLGQGRYGYASSGGRFGARRFPIGGFPVAHAIWELNKELRAENAPLPNIIQQRIVPEIIRHQYKSGLDTPLLIAAQFGGPDIDTFLLRQNWAAPPDPPWTDCFWIFGNHINKWLYVLAYLNDEAGRKFRQEHADLIMALADKLCEHSVGDFELRQFDFIFADPGLAIRYWPRFARLCRQRQSSLSSSKLENQWRYLLKMGDVASPEMFVEAWKETDVEYVDFYSARHLLERLDRKMYQKTAQAIIEEMQKNPDYFKNVSDNARKETIRELQVSVRKDDPQWLFETLQQGPQSDRERLWKYVPLWLEHTEPDSPLVEMLAKADDPKLRVLVMGALRSYPTPAHQVLLEQLLKDPEATVREAAEKTAEELKILAEADIRQFTSDYSSSVGQDESSQDSSLRLE
jgi:hypothetical protein